MTRAYAPTELGAALRILSEEEGAVPVAGCTDLLVVLHATGRRHETVVSLLRIPELQGIRVEAGFLSVGAACTFAEIRRDREVAERFPILTRAAATIGAWQIQARATIGGNIANASPAGDSLPVLLALDAELLLARPGGERRVPYSSFHLGYRKTALARGELIERILLPLPGPASVQGFRKVGTRAAQAISKVSLAFQARKVEGRLRGVRLAAGSVAATPIRLSAAEKVCEGLNPCGAVAQAAASAAMAEIRPISDVRSTAEYRRMVLGALVRRMLLKAIRD